jgi:hypothetical protein
VNSTDNTTQLVSTRSRVARIATATVAATATAAVSLLVSPVAAHATVVSPPVAAGPLRTQPTRIAIPAPTTPAYVAPLLIPTADVIIASRPDPQGNRTITVRTSSHALAGKPAGLVGRIVVVAPPGLPQMVVQITSAAKSSTAWTLVAKPVSAMAALAAGDYPVQPQFTASTFKTASGRTVRPTAISPTSVSSSASASYTFELGPYTETYQCGDGGEVKLTADLKLTPSIDADADIGWFSLNSAHLIAGLDEVATISAATSGPSDTAATCSKKVTLGSFKVPIDIGPLVADVTFSLKADIKASLQGTVSVSATQSFSGRAGVKYDGDSWSFVDDATANTPSFPTPDVRGKDSVEVGLTAEAGLSFYDVLSGKIDLRAYAGIKTQAPPAPAFDFYAGVKLSYEIDAFGYDIADGVIWQYPWDLWNSPVVNTAKLPGAHWGPPHVIPGTPPSYSYQLAASGGVGHLTYSRGAGALPDGLTLSQNGLISGTPRPPVVTCDPPCTGGGTPDRTFTFTVVVTDTWGFTGSRQLTLQVGTVLVSAAKLPDGYVGKAYSANLTTTGAVGATTWRVLSGNLPPRLSLSAAGRISGTPNTAGTYPFVVQVTDSTGNTATMQESIAINSMA